MTSEQAQSSVSRLFDDAVSCHQHGNLGQAEKIYRKILDSQPDHPDALNLLGVLVSQTGRQELAFDLINKAVSLIPDVPEYHNNLALVLGRLGRREEAVDVYETALRLNPEYIEARYNLGFTLFSSGKYEEAVEQFEKILLMRPHDANVWNSLGQALHRVGKTERGKQAYMKALKYNPDFAFAHNNLGSLLQDQGKIEEAISEFREAIRISPGYAVAYSNLAYANKCASCNDDVVIQIKSLLESGSPNSGGIILLNYALGKLYDDCGEYDLAFFHYKRANELKSKEISSRPIKIQQHVDRLINTFTPGYFEKRRKWGNTSEQPVFVIGMPRSGTSLVEQIVASHPQAAGAGELDYFNQQTGLLAGTMDAIDTQLEYWLKAEQNVYQSEAQAYLKLLNNYAGDETLRIVDKMPYNFLNLGLLAVVFPNARIIHCRRNPMDMCLSIYFHYFEGRHGHSYSLADIGQYYQQYRRLMEHWKTLPLSILELEYENIISKQEEMSRKLIEFIGLPWDEKCLEFYHSNRITRSRSNVQVRQPIYSNSVERWKNYAKHLGPLKESLGDIYKNS